MRVLYAGSRRARLLLMIYPETNKELASLRFATFRSGQRMRVLYTGEGRRARLLLIYPEINKELASLRFATFRSDQRMRAASFNSLRRRGAAPRRR